MIRNSLVIFSLILVDIAHSALNTDCLSQTQSAGPNEGNSFSHNDDLRTTKFNPDMRIASIRGCVSSDRRVTGLTVKLTDRTDESNYFFLPNFGSTAGYCRTFTIDSDQYITSIETGSDDNGVTYMVIVSSNSLIIFGEKITGFGLSTTRLSFSEDK